MVKARVRNMQGVSAYIEDITPQYVKGLRRNNCWYYEDGYCRKQMMQCVGPKICVNYERKPTRGRTKWQKKTKRPPAHGGLFAPANSEKKGK